jgi:hypothetical protein
MSDDSDTLATPIVDVGQLSEEGSTVSFVRESIQPSFDAGVSEVTRDE